MDEKVFKPYVNYIQLWAINCKIGGFKFYTDTDGSLSKILNRLKITLSCIMSCM